MHSALTGVHILVTSTPEHAHWFAQFCWGLLILTAEKGNAIGISYSDACSFVTFFLGFHILTAGNVFLCLTMIQKRKNIKTLSNLIHPLVQNRCSRASILFLLHIFIPKLDRFSHLFTFGVEVTNIIGLGFFVCFYADFKSGPSEAMKTIK
jgi:hypothetical protein